MWLTEKPKREGCVAKSRVISVDLPVPEGPEKTMGRVVCGELVGGIVNWRRVWKGWVERGVGGVR